MFSGPCPVRLWERSSSEAVSRLKCSRFSVLVITQAVSRVSSPVLRLVRCRVILATWAACGKFQSSTVSPCTTRFPCGHDPRCGHRTSRSSPAGQRVQMLLQRGPVLLHGENA